MKKMILVFFLTVCGVSAGWAQPDARHFPSDAKWMLHLDLKALNASPMGQFARESLGAEGQRRLAALKAMSGIDLTNDVDSVVVCGRGDTRAGGLLYAYGRFDIAKLTAIAGRGKEFQNKALGERSVLSWLDRGKRANLCFIDPTLAVMSQEEALIQEAVARIDGQKPGPDAGQRFASILAHNTNRFFAFQATDLAALAGTNPNFQLFRQAEAVLLEIGQADGANGLDCALALKAPNAETAQQMNQAAMGLQALVMLQAAQNPGAAALAQGITVAVKDTYVTVNLSLSGETLRTLAQTQIAQRESAQAARQAKQEAAPARGVEKQPKRPAF
ncbi:MAG: hypothetical protein PHV28_06590 [Kiritimatiellae bacterium]|nr:hypothetical protein [Kiritimatiellia bacterium]